MEDVEIAGKVVVVSVSPKGAPGLLARHLLHPLDDAVVHNRATITIPFALPLASDAANQVLVGEFQVKGLSYWLVSVR